MDDDELCKILSDQSKSIDNKISSLQRRADGILKNVEIDLKTNYKVDKIYITTLNDKRSKIINLKKEIDQDGSINDIKKNILRKRKADVKDDLDRLKSVLSAATELVDFERRLSQKFESLVDQSNHFNKMSELLSRYDGTKMNSLKLLQSYSNRVKILNPINALVNIWTESVTLRNDTISIRSTVSEAVDGLIILDRLDYFLKELFTSLCGMLDRTGSVSFKKGVFNLVETESYSMMENIRSLGRFLKYLAGLGILMDTDNCAMVESVLLEKYLKPTIPSDSDSSSEIEKMISKIQQFSHDLHVQFPNIDQFAIELADLITNAKLAKSLSHARSIVTRSELLSSTVKPTLHDLLEPVNGSDLSLSDTTRASIDLKFQNINYPISQQCGEIWKLMLTDVAAAHLLVNIYILFMPRLHRREIKENIQAYCIFSNDIHWLIGGLTRLSFTQQLDRRQKLNILTIIHQLNKELNRYQQMHIDTYQTQYREIIGEKLKLFDSIENQDEFEELMIIISDIISLFNNTKTKLTSHLPPVPLHTMLSEIAVYIINIVCEHILTLNDISVDSCTPIDTIISKFGVMNGYDQTVAEDIRFLLRSSLSEIIGMWKTGETKLTSTQVRSMIRALFSNTDHRSNALSLIK